MQKLWKNGSISYTLIVYYLNFMKKLVLLTLAFLLTACSVVTTPGSKNNQTNPQNTPRNNSSNSSQTDSRTIEQRLSSEVSYGSGAHVVVLFSDFQCPACIRFEGSIMPMLESYAASGRLQIVFKQYPLVSIHKNAYRDSLAAMCAYEQGKYMDYKKRIYDFEEKKSMASVSDEERIALLEWIEGVDTAKFSACLANDTYKSMVDRDMADGEALNIPGTPTLFFDGKRLDFGVFNGMEQIEQFFASRL